MQKLIDLSYQAKQELRTLSDEEKTNFLKQLHPDWQLNQNPVKLIRKFKFKNFNAPLEFINKLAIIAEDAKHHPDIHFGWGYCLIEIQTHTHNDVLLNDYILAAKIENCL
jgi:4a-hydroxytetrahydrobiopterin dehydratase